MEIVCTCSVNEVIFVLRNIRLSRYLLHSADLSFLEAMSQTLTSAQVGIKSEVARSNGQAREIFQNMDRISALTRQVQAKVHSTLLCI